MKRDIKLKNAMLCWYSSREPEGPYAEVIRHPDTHGKSRGMSAVLACGSYQWHEATNKQRLLKLMIEVWHVVCRDGVPVGMMHDALMVIPEYREMLSEDFRVLEDEK